MTCDALQTFLLGLDEPGRPAEPAARQHLAQCPACRDWQTQLVQMERACALLPVPTADDARETLLRKILATPAKPQAANGGATRPSVAMVLGSFVLDRHASPRRRVGAGIVIGVAASLLLFVAGWLVWFSQHQANQAPAFVSARRPTLDPFLDELTTRGVKGAERVAAATTPRDRVRALADAAEEVRGRHRELVRTAPAAEVTQWAQLYRRVVEDGLVRRAGDLPGDERRGVLEPIARDLQLAGSEASRLALEQDVPESAKQALQEIALAAAQGSILLQKLYEPERF